MAKISLKKGVNIGKVVAKLVATVIALYVGGTIMTEIGNVLLCTASPFYKGLALIGWTVSDNAAINATLTVGSCNTTAYPTLSSTTYNGLITSTSGAGILAVVGIIGIASIVMEFVNFSM